MSIILLPLLPFYGSYTGRPALDDGFITNLQLSLTLREFRKSSSIWQSEGKESVGTFLPTVASGLVFCAVL